MKPGGICAGAATWALASACALPEVTQQQKRMGIKVLIKHHIRTQTGYERSPRIEECKRQV